MPATYTTAIAASSTPALIRAFVTSPAGATYGVTLSRALVTCSCPHHMYRAPKTCKHMTFLVEHLASEHRKVWRDEAKSEAARALWSKAAAWVALAEMEAPKAAKRAAA